MDVKMKIANLLTEIKQADTLEKVALEDKLQALVIDCDKLLAYSVLRSLTYTEKVIVKIIFASNSVKESGVVNYAVVCEEAGATRGALLGALRKLESLEFIKTYNSKLEILNESAIAELLEMIDEKIA